MNTNTMNLSVGIAALTLLVGGCGRPTIPSAASSGSASLVNGNDSGRPRHLYAGLDTSASWRPHLGVSAMLCARQALGLDPDHDRLTLYRLDSTTREFFDDPAPESGDRLQRTIVTEVASVSETRGTFPALFWTAAAARAEADAGPVTVEVFSDGDNDDLTARSASTIRAAARRLAANPRVSGVWVFGAEPRNWAILRAEFAPLGGRFHLCVPPDMTADRVAQALP